MISIIGAGPAGLYSAYLLSKKGYDVKVFEQKDKVGMPIQCTGIVTSKIKEIFQLKEKVIKNRIRRIEVNSKTSSACIKLKEPDMILDRSKFDQEIKDMAEKASAEVILRNKFIKKDRNGIILKDIIKNKTKRINTDCIIGADGPLSQVYNILNPNVKKEFYKGIQARINGNFEKDMFKVYLGSVCPDFFAWVVPENESVARVGLATRMNQKEMFDKFLEKIDVKKNKIIEMQAGLIPMYNPKVTTFKEKIYLIGDAATQLKASTGGGIVQGLVAAEELCKSICENKNYDREWRKKLGKDLWTHLQIRKYLNRFKDNDYDKLVSMLKNNRLREILEKETRDNPSKFFVKMIKAEPKLLYFASKLFLG